MPKFRRKPQPKIDFEGIYAAADCRTVAGAYLEKSEGRAGRFVCPSCGKSSLTCVQKVWSCWSCSAHAAEGNGRDAIGLVALATGESRAKAAKRLAADLGIGPTVATAGTVLAGQRPAVEPKPTGPEPPELGSWQKGLAKALRESHARLMDRSCDTSRRAWDYLTGERGLILDTIEAGQLGVNLRWLEFHEPLPNRDGKPCSLPPGITMPWISSLGGLVGANVRQFHEPLRDKYLMAKGSRRWWLYPGLIGWDDWPGPVIIVEGEFDALLANQELSGLLPVFTAGGASCRPDLLREPHKLTRFSRLLIATDNDAAGHKCRDAWLDFSRRAVPVDLPGGKDLSEAHAAGADLRSWLFEVCRGMKIDLHALPGLVWEKPLGTIRGRLLDDPRHAAEHEAEAAAEREAIENE